MICTAAYTQLHAVFHCKNDWRKKHQIKTHFTLMHEVDKLRSRSTIV